MKRYALVENNIVTNVVLWDGKSEYAVSGLKLVDISATPEVGIGDTKTSKGWKKSASVEKEPSALDILEDRIEQLEKLVIAGAKI